MPQPIQTLYPCPDVVLRVAETRKMFSWGDNQLTCLFCWCHPQQLSAAKILPLDINLSIYLNHKHTHYKRASLIRLARFALPQLTQISSFWAQSCHQVPKLFLAQFHNYNGSKVALGINPKTNHYRLNQAVFQKVSKKVKKKTKNTRLALFKK